MSTGYCSNVNKMFMLLSSSERNFVDKTWQRTANLFVRKSIMDVCWSLETSLLQKGTVCTDCKGQCTTNTICEDRKDKENYSLIDWFYGTGNFLETSLVARFIKKLSLFIETNSPSWNVHHWTLSGTSWVKSIISHVISSNKFYYYHLIINV